jgi:hypothetical protein
MRTEGVEIEFTPEGVEEIARIAAQVNERTENIGARRLHTGGSCSDVSSRPPTSPTDRDHAACRCSSRGRGEEPGICAVYSLVAP